MASAGALDAQGGERLMRLPLLGFRGDTRDDVRALVPADPQSIVDGPLDPELERLRASLLPHRRRLWVRRIVRRAWIALAAVVAAELVLWIAARFVPIELAPTFGASIPVLGLAALLVAAVRALPSLGETALALDSEGRLGDRLTSALALAAMLPGAAGSLDGSDGSDGAGDEPALDQPAQERRFIRRQRHDALAALAVVPANLFRPRLSMQPATAALVAALILAPVVLLPNPQNAVIEQTRQVREEARRQADKVERLADELDGKGADVNDPRRDLARQLRDLARQLRDRPADLDVNLARLGSVEGALRSQLDPANEQRAASLSSLSRSLSRTATGSKSANADGDPKDASDDLRDLAGRLDATTPEQQRDLARQLAELQSTASQADGAAGQALRDATQSLAQGDVAGAKAALDRLGESLKGAQQRVQVNRDLAGAASRLQDSRRDLANAGRPGTQGQQGAQPGQGGQQGQSGQSGQPGQGQAGQSGQPGQGQAGQSGQPGQGQGQGQGQGLGQGQGQGQGQSQGLGQGQGQGQGQSQGQGSLGGGGSNARYLGSGVGGNGRPGGPVNPNRPSTLGGDLSSVFAPFERIGKPGDPSYVAGTGGDGQSQQGNQQGQGVDNGSFVPYSDVFGTFYDFAQTTLDRNYVPLSVKDYVRDYFSSLDPSR